MPESRVLSCSDADANLQTIPIAREEAEVHKQEVETGRVRIHKTVHEREEVLRDSLRSQEVEMERVALNRQVDGPPEPRYEGEWMIIPVLEEVLVVEKRWVLKEEIRLRLRVTERPHEERVVLRTEQANVERIPGSERN
jgi:uncharacterized protein (TIGR02271 family)